MDEAEVPTSPAGWLLVKRAMHGACSGFAAPDADGARAPNTPRLAIRATLKRCGIAFLLWTSRANLHGEPPPHNRREPVGGNDAERCYEAPGSECGEALVGKPLRCRYLVALP